MREIAKINRAEPPELHTTIADTANMAALSTRCSAGAAGATYTQHCGHHIHNHTTMEIVLLDSPNALCLCLVPLRDLCRASVD